MNKLWAARDEAGMCIDNIWLFSKEPTLLHTGIWRVKPSKHLLGHIVATPKLPMYHTIEPGECKQVYMGAVVGEVVEGTANVLEWSPPEQDNRDTIVRVGYGRGMEISDNPLGLGRTDQDVPVLILRPEASHED